MKSSSIFLFFFLSSCAGTDSDPARSGDYRNKGDGSGPVETVLESPRIELEMPSSGFEVLINGEGPFHLGLDTGQSTALLLSSRVADRLGLPVAFQVSVGDGSRRNAAKVDMVSIESLKLGGAVFRDLMGIVMDVPGDGALGFSLFCDCLFTLDAGRGRILLEEGKLPLSDDETILPLVMDRGATPSITIKMAGRDISVLIDSAWKEYVAVPAVLESELPLKASPIPTRRVATLFNEFEIKAANLDGDICIGAHRIEDPELEFNGMLPEVILGHKILRDFVVTFDQRNLRIRFERKDRE